jgi:hypothetical protein
MNNLIADIQIAPNNGFTGIGNSVLAQPTGSGIVAFSTFISTVIGIMTLIAFIWFLFVLITGAIGIISSGGDKQALENARKKITSGFVGLIIVIAAVFVIDIVGTVFGIKFLDIAGLFSKIAGIPSP